MELMFRIPKILYLWMMKSLLVATDFSPQSYYTLRYVLNSLKNTTFPTRILLVNTYLMDLSNEPNNFIQLNDDLKNNSKKNLERQKSEELVWVRNPNIQIETASHMGSLSNVLLNLIKKEKIEQVFIGETTDKSLQNLSILLKKNNCDLFIVDQEKAEVI